MTWKPLRKCSTIKKLNHVYKERKYEDYNFTEKTCGYHAGYDGTVFEDINYAADGGLYAEMLENRAFEFVDCYGDKADYYTEFDGLYGWECYPKEKNARMRCVMGSPVAEENPHYLRFTAEESQAGFKNQAYDGIVLKKDAQYEVSFYARSISYQGRIQISVQKDGIIAASGETELLPGKNRSRITGKISSFTYCKRRCKRRRFCCHVRTDRCCGV